MEQLCDIWPLQAIDFIIKEVSYQPGEPPAARSGGNQDQAKKTKAIVQIKQRLYKDSSAGIYVQIVCNMVSYFMAHQLYSFQKIQIPGFL